MLMIAILLVMTGILIGVVAKLIDRYIHLPYTVTLFAIGIIIGVLSGYPDIIGNEFFSDGVTLVSEMNPDFILYVFLPILVFDAAYEMDLHVFRKTLINASLLAGPGLVICMLLTAGMIMGGEWLFCVYNPAHWPFALMFGGLISATDPVAVVALLQELGTSKRFSTLVDGESLLNDGTGLVCFMMFYCAYDGQGNIGNPLLYFAWVCIASVAIGFVVSKLTLWLVLKSGLDEPLQNCIIVAAAYITFMIAQSAFSVSGVIALVAFGHDFAQSCRPHLKPGVNEFMEKFWGFMAHIANTLIFLIVGIIIAAQVDVTWTDMMYIVLIFIGLNVIRYIMIYMLFPLLNRSGYGLSLRESVILGWGGLRGALGMSMALMVSCNTNIPHDIRESILTCTAGVVTLTLCINATTSKWLVKKLHLIEEKTAAEKHIWNGILSLIHDNDKTTIETLKKNPYLKTADWGSVEKKAITVSQVPDSPVNITGDDMLYFVRKVALANEYSKAQEFYNDGVLNYDSYNHIMTSLAVLDDFDGKHPLDDRALRKHIHRRNFFDSKKVHLTNACCLCRGIIMIELECLDILKNAKDTNIFNLSVDENAINAVCQEMKNLMAEATAILDEYSQSEPEIFNAGVTTKATRMLLAKERALIESLLNQGILSPDTADTLLCDIDKRQGIEIIA